MNDRDSEALLGLFLEKGYQKAQSEEEADIILVNTCSVREHAEQRAISFLGSLKRLVNPKSETLNSKQIPNPKSQIPKKFQIQNFNSQNPKRGTQYAKRSTKIIGLIGCMARNRGEELFRKMPHVSLVCGPSSFNKIPEYISRIKDSEVSGKRVRIKDLDDSLRDEELYRAAFRIEPNHAQVVISTGCSNYCSYCIVPYVRGPLRLRNPDDIIEEVKRNIALGIKKITLLGQNVNDYEYKSQVISQCGAKRSLPEGDKSQVNFVELLSMVEKIDGVEELSFITSQPKNVPEGLFELMAESKKISKCLHLPFQSGSNRILKLMNRSYNREKYLQLVADYKRIVKGSLSTDIIVGFPSETEEDFEQTKDIVKKVEFEKAYIFKYSPRMHTASSKLKDDIFDDIKSKRHKILLDLQRKISLAKI